MNSASRCNNPTYLCGPSKYSVSGEAIWDQNGKLRKFLRTYLHGTVFARRKYFYQKNLRAWRDQKCIPLVGAITPLTCAGRQSTPSRGRRYRAQNGKLPKIERTYRHGTVFAPTNPNPNPNPREAVWGAVWKVA